MKNVHYDDRFQEIDLSEEDIQGRKKSKPKKILICIDNGVGKATGAAYCVAAKNYKKGDKIYLVNIYSSWDYLNDEKNAGKLVLEQYSRLCKTDGMKVELSKQVESDDPQGDLLSIIDDLKIDEVYIGETSYCTPAGQTNLLFSSFSYLKQKMSGTMAEYLLAYCPCRCVVVPDVNVLKEIDLIPSPEDFVKTSSCEIPKDDNDI